MMIHLILKYAIILKKLLEKLTMIIKKDRKQ